jgi:hypothetical protein
MSYERPKVAAKKPFLSLPEQYLARDNFRWNTALTIAIDGAQPNSTLSVCSIRLPRWLSFADGTLFGDCKSEFDFGLNETVFFDHPWGSHYQRRSSPVEFFSPNEALVSTIFSSLKFSTFSR